MRVTRFLEILWPAFLAACLLELLVFAMVDPQDIHWSGQPLGLSRMAVYTGAFFAFWAISTVASAGALLLARSPAEVNGSPVPLENRPRGFP